VAGQLILESARLRFKSVRQLTVKKLFAATIPPVNEHLLECTAVSLH